MNGWITFRACGIAPHMKLLGILVTQPHITAQGKAREAEVDRLNARTIEDDMADASLEELDELEDELADDGMLEKYR